MSEAQDEEIVRIAARGDGVTASGRHAPHTAPGDLLLAGGGVRPGPHHVAPVCRHFGDCGGCELQHVDDAALADFVRERIVHALAAKHIEAECIAPVHLSPPASRRRASLRAIRTGGAIQLGFNSAQSSRIIDLAECHVIRPELFAVLAPLRKLLATHAPGRYSAVIEVALLDQGVDIAIGHWPAEGLKADEALVAFAREHGLARLGVDRGLGPETVWEPDPATVTLSGVPVSYPPGGFLQATGDGEAALVAAARESLHGAKLVADLFSGLGTFAFALSEEDPARKVYAGEAARDPSLACKAAAQRHGRQVFVDHRDLFRNPLRPEELNRFEAVLLDPPRAGAAEQVARIAESAVPRLCYVSCNPSTFARDARVLADAGFRLAKLWPVGQFRWSTHVELAARFER